MALQIKNLTNQTIPLVVGVTEVRLLPRKTIVVALDQPTQQILRLAERKLIQVRR